MSFSEPWEWEGKKFVRCYECGKAMPEHFKTKHKCEPKEHVKESTFTNGKEVRTTEKDIMAISIRDAVEICRDYNFSASDVKDIAIELFKARKR